MGRRRRRHADPAQLPRREKEAAPPGKALLRRRSSADRETEARREAALRDLARLHESFARTTSVLGAATLYFAVWVADLALGLFPPPQGLDLGHPQFLVGVLTILASLYLTRYLARTVPTARLVRYASGASLALGVVLAGVLGVTFREGAGGEATLLAVGVGVSWVLTTLWLAVLGRRFRQLQAVARAGQAAR